jgi:radical SAM superfamily enzyme YgiQ (UPF0313 family)
VAHIPYGLLSLAAQALGNGHAVTVLNLFTFAWRDVCEIIRQYPSDLFGLSCFTSNRRGVLATARFIREIYPHAHVTVGGPHASALPLEMLEHCDAIDTIVIGEGEETFNELIARLEHKQSTRGIHGTAYRNRDEILLGPPRRMIANLDSLIPPSDCFDDHIVLTSRGCCEQCSFCASPVLWSKKVRSYSTGYILEMLETLVHKHGHCTIAFKDDTFTGNRRRTLDLCHHIIKRKLNFLWSCDTRPDALDEELLFNMRTAGCQRISLGVESASTEILRSLHKKTTPEQILTATGLARTFGFQVRFYLIAGSPRETAETLKETVAFLKIAQPSQYIFNPFTLLPGTLEFSRAEHAGRVTREVFFTGDFYDLHTFPEQSGDPELHLLIENIGRQPAVQHGWNYSVQELQSILTLFPELPAAHMDLGGAWYREGNMAEAETHISRALLGGYPLPGLGYNYLACIAVKKHNMRGALEYLLRARECGLHQVVEENLQSVRDWLASGVIQRDKPFTLIAHHEFEITRRNTQPITPGPITIHAPDRPQARIFKPCN